MIHNFLQAGGASRLRSAKSKLTLAASVAVLAGCSVLLCHTTVFAQTAPKTTDDAEAKAASDAAARAWAQMPAILKRIVPPKFPAREFDITKYGAVGDGTADCTKAFADAIAACNKAGGGRVVVPAGKF